jgi:hypothetical protein
VSHLHLLKRVTRVLEREKVDKGAGFGAQRAHRLDAAKATKQHCHVGLCNRIAIGQEYWFSNQSAPERERERKCVA